MYDFVREYGSSVMSILGVKKDVLCKREHCVCRCIKKDFSYYFSVDPFTLRTCNFCPECGRELNAISAGKKVKSGGEEEGVGEGKGGGVRLRDDEEGGVASEKRASCGRKCKAH